MPINKIWRWTESTLRSGWWSNHTAGIYSDCSTREIIIIIVIGVSGLRDSFLHFGLGKFRHSRCIGVVNKTRRQLACGIQLRRSSASSLNVICASCIIHSSDDIIFTSHCSFSHMPISTGFVTTDFKLYTHQHSNHFSVSYPTVAHYHERCQIQNVCTARLYANAVLAVAWCLSVCDCHKLELIWNGWMDRAGYRYPGFLRSRCYKEIRGVRVSLK